MDRGPRKSSGERKAGVTRNNVLKQVHFVTTYRTTYTLKGTYTLKTYNNRCIIVSNTAPQSTVGSQWRAYNTPADLQTCDIAN